MSAIEQGIWREVLAQINEATINGILESSGPTPSEAFLSALRHSNEVFAAFKVHALQQEVAAKLLTSDGRLKSFADFRRDVESITSHQCGAWLRTEYDTAVIRAHNAADWQSYEANKDVMPNLRWMPTTSVAPEQGHRSFWLARLNLPVTDPFWQHHHPGDHWNCKCSLEQNDDPVVRPADIPMSEQPDRGLENNPGKDGHTFSDNHPYFPSSCNACPFNKDIKNKVSLIFRNEKKHCYECEKVDAIYLNKGRNERYCEYLQYCDNSSYKDVCFDETSMGLKATHIGHNIDKKRGWYEITAQDVGFKNGHKVILEEENHTILYSKNTEGTWDDMLFEIAGAETATANNIRQALKHCVSKPNVEVAVLFFPNDNFDNEIFETGFAKFNGLKGTSQYRLLKYIYCIDKEKIILTKKPE